MHRHSSLFASSHSVRRWLYQIASVRTVTKTRAEKRRAIHIDLAIGLGIPLLRIPLHYIVEGHRYNIFEDISCLGETYEIPLAVVLFHLPPILIDAVSAVYCVSIKSFYHSRAQFRLLLSASASANLAKQVPPPHCARVHQPAPHHPARHLGPVGEHARHRAQPVDLLGRHPHERGDAKVSDGGVCAFVLRVLRCVGYSTARSSGLSSTGTASKSPLSPSSSRGASATLPVFIRKDTTQKRDSSDSFSDMSASYGGISPLEYEDKEKVSDCSSSPSSYSSASSSASSDTESVGEEEEGKIEVSSLHRTSVHISSLLEPAHMRRSSALDGPMPVVDAADIV
ncbi:pheromone A receptor-domain-containing protein [Mycena leptocephala]|nr:pheromone A receptor-domain-containing protein [Mycena leptocephala]